MVFVGGNGGGDGGRLKVEELVELGVGIQWRRGFVMAGQKLGLLTVNEGEEKKQERGDWSSWEYIYA